MKHDLITDNAFGIFIRPRPINQRRFVNNLELLGNSPKKLHRELGVYTFLVEFFEKTSPTPELVNAILKSKAANTFHSLFFVYVKSVTDYVDAVHGLKRFRKQLGQCKPELLEELETNIIKQQRYATQRFQAIDFNYDKIKPTLDLLGEHNG